MGVERLLEVKDRLQEEVSAVEEEKEKERERERESVEALLGVIKAVMDEVPSPEAASSPSPRLEEVGRVLGRELADMLDFSQRGDVVVIRRKRFLDREDWLAITDKVGQLNGRWISSGKDSRWEIYSAD